MDYIIKREKIPELTKEENERAVFLVNELSACVNEDDKAILQSFVENYNNYLYYRQYTQGIWVSKEEDLSPEEQEKHFQLEF